MKSLFVSLLISVAAINAFTQDTIIYQDSVTLNSSLSGYDNVEVIGYNGITLDAGFAYSSSGNGKFTANGDPMGVEVPSGFAPYGGADQDSTGSGSPVLDLTKVVGSVIGNAGVSGSGAGTYHIPIQVPIGNNGMEPELSLSYNSQNNSSGIMGRGWNLNGLSSITTTGRNYYHDGEKGALSAKDSLSCLNWDGQRLFGINAKGLEADSFKTEIKSYSKIEKKSGTNGTYFEIETPNGNTLIYGQSEAAQMHFSDTLEWKWMLEEVQDRIGNSIKYNYTKDSQKHQILLSSITYGGESTDPLNEIVFTYTSKTRLKYAYILDNLVVADQKLDRISIKCNDTTELGFIPKGYSIGGYRMNYQTSDSETLLSSVIQNDEDGYQYNPTRINWEVPAFNLEPTSDTITIESGSNYTYFTGDYNGDGFSDLVTVELDYDNNDYIYYMYYGSSSGLSSSYVDGDLPRSYTHRFWDDMKSSLDSECDEISTSDYTIPDISYIISGDFDGDGVDELMVKTREWNAFASYLPEDLNSGIENTLWATNGFNGFEIVICTYEDYIMDPENTFELTDLSTYFGNFIHFDETINSEDRITVVRLEGDNETIPADSRYPDLLGKGYSPFIDDGKVKYYDIKNDTAIAYRNSSGGHIWSDLDGDGLSDNLIQFGNSFMFYLTNPDPDGGPFSGETEGTFLGTIDLNGDGTNAYAYLVPEEYEYSYYIEPWLDYCTSDCGQDGDLLDVDTWQDFLELYDIESEYDDYITTDCGGVNNVDCVNDFLNSTVYETTYLGREFIIKHINGHGPTINFGHDFFVPASDDAHTLAADLNADGMNELLLFDGDVLVMIVYNFVPSYSSGDMSFTYSDTTLISQPTPLKQQISFYLATLQGDFNGDGIVEYVTPSANRILSFNATDQAGFFVSDVTNGLGQDVRFHYEPLTDDDVYTMGTGAEYPVIDFTTPWHVVSSLAMDNGVANPDSTTYSYKDGKIHVAGRGFLGFLETTAENHLSNSTSISESQYDTTYYHPLTVSNTTKIDGDMVAKMEYRTRVDSGDILDARIYKIRNDSIISQDYLNDVTQTTLLVFNSLGQVTEKTLEVGSTADIVESYTYESAGWYYPYLPRTLTKEFERGGSVSSDSTLVQYSSQGLVQSVKQYCGTDRELETILSNYDDYGVPGRISKHGKWGPSLVTDSLWLEIERSSGGRFISAVEGPLNNRLYYDIDVATGLLNSQTTVNDITTEMDYGPFGILEKKTLQDNTQVHSRIYWSNGHPNEPAGSLYLSWSKASGTNEGITFYDAAGRQLRTLSYGFNGEKLLTDSEYDSNGRLLRSSLPYESGNTPLWSNISYDDYGRVDEQLAPDSTKTAFTYDDLWKKTTISKGSESRSAELTYNELGEVIESKDAMNNSVYTSYYPNGLVKETYTSVNPSHKIELIYDAQGNRISIDDPDSGKDTTLYDAFGKLLWHVNAKGDTTTFEYDKLGRTIQSTDSRGDINFVYISDTTCKAFAMVDSIYNSDGSLSESFSYGEDYGRLISATRRMPDKTFTNSYSYDWYGRPWTRTYPSGYELEYSYNDGGHLDKITGDGSTIWSCSDVNELGQITSYSQGSYSTVVDYDPFGMLEEITTGSVFNMKFDFDDLGNLTSREDVRTNQKELFAYDNLNRLTGIDYYLNSTHQTSHDLDLTYGNDGNISSKTDVGSTINYGEPDAGPHALTSIEDLEDSYEPPPQEITYNSFNKVSSIQDTIGQDTTLTLEFTYGLNNQRVKTVLSRNSTVERIRYFNGDYEEDSTATGTKKYHYINAPSGLAGIYVQEGSADTLFHVLKDQLGSVSAVINAETDAVSYYSYNAWGVPRDPDDWTGAFDGELFAGRGYTGHEHLSEFNLINMNGRVYDPMLARFLSPDPFVQFPGVADGYNRYAYVLNNPFIYTDPSGYMTQEEYDGIISTLLKMNSGSSWEPGVGYSPGGISYTSHVLPTFAQGDGGGGGAGGSWRYFGSPKWIRSDVESFHHGKWRTPLIKQQKTNRFQAVWVPNLSLFSFEGLWGSSTSFDGSEGPEYSSPGGSDGEASGGVASNDGEGLADGLGWAGTGFAFAGEVTKEIVNRRYYIGYLNIEGTKLGYYSKNTLLPVKPQLTRYSNIFGQTGRVFTLGAMGVNMYLATTSSDPMVVMNNVNSFFINGFSLIPGWGGVATGLLGNPIQRIGEIGAQNFRENNVPFEYYHMVGGLGPSDSTLKENLEPLEDAISKIQRLNGYEFTWKQDSTNRADFGVIAQEVEKVFPEMVLDDPDLGYKQVYYYKLIPVLIEALKEQQQIIDQQQQAIDVLLNHFQKEGLQIEKD